MKIFYFDRTGGACDYYRATLPLTTLAKTNVGFKAATMTRADLMVAIERDDTDQIMGLLDADIILLPRLAETKMLDHMKDLNPRAKLVVEYDDDLFNISPFSPHYVDHGTEEVKIQLPDGKVVDLWVDGKNINIQKNRESMDHVKEVVGRADLVTVTTPILAKAYEPYAKNIACLPNCIDKNLWKKLPLKAREDVRMGWFGGSSHYEDWTLLEDVLPVVMEKHKNLKMVLMGARFEGTIKKLPQDRVEFHQWVPTTAYPYKAAILDLDFSIIPLRDTAFNRSKSNIKWVEMGSLEVPSVVSYVSPYKEAATEGNGVWVEDNTTDGWIDGISMLAENPKLRSQIGAEAWKTVMDNFEIHGQAWKWAKAYEGVLNGVSNTADSVGHSN